MVFKALTETTGQGLGLRRPCRVQRAVRDRRRVGCRNHGGDRSCSVSRARSFLVPSIADATRAGDHRRSVAREPDATVDASRWNGPREEARSAEICRRLSGAPLLHARNEAGLWRDPELQLTLKLARRAAPDAGVGAAYDPDFERAESFLAASCAARDADAASRQSRPPPALCRNEKCDGGRMRSLESRLQALR